MKLHLTIAPLAALIFLPACSLFDDTDPREGAETVEACAARVAENKLDITVQDGALFVPTYTYDITKVALDDLKDLIVTGSDETAGSRGMTSTNETSTAVQNFMAEPVDENGSFFMGRDPALYRVRGEPVALDDIITAGCERQKTGMRLTSYSADLYDAEPALEPEDAAE